MDTTGTHATAAGSTDGPARPTGRPPEWLSRALFESVLIVFSVLLALGLNEWSEGRKQAAHARVALAAVVSELEANRKTLQSAHEFHVKVKSALQDIQVSGGLPSEQMATGGMFQPARPVTTAWESARESGATSELPYDLVLELSRIYQSLDRYNDLGMQMTIDVYADLRRRGVEAVLREGYPGVLLLVIDFSTRERRLVESLDAALATVGAVR